MRTFKCRGGLANDEPLQLAFVATVSSIVGSKRAPTAVPPFSLRSCPLCFCPFWAYPASLAQGGAPPPPRHRGGVAQNTTRG